jgi:hypothetical protein
VFMVFNVDMGVVLCVYGYRCMYVMCLGDCFVVEMENRKGFVWGHSFVERPRKDLVMKKVWGGDTNLGLDTWNIEWRGRGRDSLRKVLEKGRKFVPVGTEAVFLQFGGNDEGVDSVGEIVEKTRRVVTMVQRKCGVVMVGEIFPRYQTKYGTVKQYGEDRKEVNEELRKVYEGSPQVDFVHPYR